MRIPARPRVGAISFYAGYPATSTHSLRFADWWWWIDNPDEPAELFRECPAGGTEGGIVVYQAADWWMWIELASCELEP